MIQNINIKIELATSYGLATMSSFLSTFQIEYSG
jgi:hypothetical protein